MIFPPNFPFKIIDLMLPIVVYCIVYPTGAIDLKIICYFVYQKYYDTNNDISTCQMPKYIKLLFHFDISYLNAQYWKQWSVLSS